MLTAFVAHLSAVPIIPSMPGTVAINLSTTGDAASKWVIHWATGVIETDLASSQPGGTFGTVFQPTHNYSEGNYTITATATATASGATSTTAYGLNANFGYNAFQGSGKEVAKPNGSTGNAAGAAMVLDTSGDSYVATAYTYPSMHNGSTYFAITKFNGPSSSTGTTGGQVATSWNPGTTSGTYIFPDFGTGLSEETDTPYAISWDQSGNLVVAGTVTIGTTTYWGVASLDLTTLTKTWETKLSTSLVSGQPTSLAPASIYGGNDTDMVVAGSSGTSMAVVAIFTGTGSVDSNFGSSGAKIIACGSSTTSIANAVLQSASGTNDIILGGTTSYSSSACGSAPNPSDFTMVELTDVGAPVSTFGSTGGVSGVYRFNYGCLLSGAFPCEYVPSQDSEYSLLEWEDASSNYYLIPVGGTNVAKSLQFAVARLKETTGQPARDGFFGNHLAYASGLTVAANGTAYAATLDSSGNIIAAGSYTSASNADFEVADFASSSGLLNTDFGNSGILQTDFGTASTNSPDVARSVGLFTDPDGKVDVLVAGSTTPAGGSAQMALADYLITNQLEVS